MFALAVMTFRLTILSNETLLAPVHGDRLIEMQRPKVAIGLRLVSNRGLTLTMNASAVEERHSLKTEGAGR